MGKSHKFRFEMGAKRVCLDRQSSFILKKTMSEDTTPAEFPAQVRA